MNNPTGTNNGIPCHEVYAIRYARTPRSRSENFVGGDPHDGPMPMAFFVWLIRNGSHCILVDTGFNAETAARRDREFLRCPVAALQALDIEPGQVQDVILTHLHYDHAGNLDKLPAARIHVQDAEMEYATGRCMCYPVMRRAYAVEDVTQLVRYVYEDRAVFHDGDQPLFPGIELLKIGGHTKGLQAVRVHTGRGWVVLASDASHYYENMESGRPFPIVFSMSDMLQGYVRLQDGADSAEHIIPGHDPLVLERYRSIAPDVAVLHEPPLPA